jgi:membrane protease YdiL (CAAX protease family)
MNIPFLSGPARYEPHGPWRPLSALAAAIALLLLTLAGGLALGIGGTIVFTGVGYGEFTPHEEALVLEAAGFAWFLLLVAGVWLVAGLRGGLRCEVLQLDGPKPTAAEIAVAVIGMGLLTAPLYGFLYLWDADWLVANYRSDMETFLAALQSPISVPVVAMLFVGSVVVAPLAEELLFRGFLMSALAKWRWGFWPAAVVVTALWAAIHLYSALGTMDVFIGGIALSWLLWRTGSLWLPVICHALGNLWAMIFAMIFVLG